MKIKSIRSLGMRQTYSPEMRSDNHNYITDNSSAVHRNSHSVAYCTVAFRCLWLKTYFPHEWWAAVMSYCNADKLVRYMNVARSEKVAFSTIDINNLSLNFQAVPDEPRQKHTDPPNGHIMPGLVCLKGVGVKVAAAYAAPGECIRRDDDDDELLNDDDEDVSDTSDDNIDIPVSVAPVISVDEFVQNKGKNKLLLERLIKLGAFSHLPDHENAKALWVYYQCKYCTGKDITALKNQTRAQILLFDGWTEETIAAERCRQAAEFKSVYPKRKIPKNIEKWAPKPIFDLRKIKGIYDEHDFTLSEILKFEEQYLGYHIHSPLDLYVTKGERSIAEAKEHGMMEAVIDNVYWTKTRNDTPMCKLTVTDGVQSASMIIWHNELANIDRAILRIGRGIRANVNWDQKRKNFTLCTGGKIICLKKRDDDAA